MFLAALVATPGIDALSNSAVVGLAMATDVAQSLRTPRHPAGMGRGGYAGVVSNIQAAHGGGDAIRGSETENSPCYYT